MGNCLTTKQKQSEENTKIEIKHAKKISLDCKNQK
jgi:hypothetical protein